MKKLIVLEPKLKEFLKKENLYEDFKKNVKYGGGKTITTINEAFNFSECVYPKRIKSRLRFWSNWDERYRKTMFNI
jgi:hypothetical protein